ncbi:hypothetical protein CPSG_06708, partial [Coccidioides posadasii str. Silveira]
VLPQSAADIIYLTLIPLFTFLRPSFSLSRCISYPPPNPKKKKSVSLSCPFTHIYLGTSRRPFDLLQLYLTLSVIICHYPPSPNPCSPSHTGRYLVGIPYPAITRTIFHSFPKCITRSVPCKPIPH